MQVAKDQAGESGGALEGRIQERFTIVWAGGLEYGDQVVPCVLLNVSEGGAMIRTALPVKPGSSVMLWSHQLGRLDSRVVWQDSNDIGLRFDERPREITKILAAFLPVSVAA